MVFASTRVVCFDSVTVTDKLVYLTESGSKDHSGRLSV